MLRMHFLPLPILLMEELRDWFTLAHLRSSFLAEKRFEVGSFLFAAALLAAFYTNGSYSYELFLISSRPQCGNPPPPNALQLVL